MYHAFHRAHEDGCSWQNKYSHKHQALVFHKPKECSIVNAKQGGGHIYSLVDYDVAFIKIVLDSALNPFIWTLGVKLVLL